MFRFLPLLLLPFLATAQSPRPNILFIMSDDHGAQAMSCYGSRINHTPNIDRIAEGGMRFDRAYCNNAICAPARAVILTGKMSHLNSVRDNRDTFDNRQPNVAKYLRAAGYQTAIVGKWHLKADPTGFDYWKVLPGQGAYYNPDFLTPAGLEHHSGYVADIITGEALGWLDRRDSSRPFFLMLHHNAPHRNWMPEPKYFHLFDSLQIPEPPTLFDDYATRSAAARDQEMQIGRDLDPAYDLKVWEYRSPRFAEWVDTFLRNLTPEQREALLAAWAEENAQFLKDSLSGEALTHWKYQRYIKNYLRCVQSVDDQVGRMLDYLNAHGLSENTIIIYTSDQGFFLGEHGWFDKRFMYEESYKIPLLMRWPGYIPAGSSSPAPVMQLDFAPTFLELAGAPVPADMQGRSLLPVLRKPGRVPSGWRDATYYHYFEYPAEHAVKRHYGIRTSRYKLIHFYIDIDAWELYDLEFDPQELHNVYAEPGYLNIRHALERKLEELRREYKDEER